MKILGLDRNRPVRPRTCKEEEEEEVLYLQCFSFVLNNVTAANNFSGC
jgi:hypothetical protein